LPEYLNLLENIRLEVKKHNLKYENLAVKELNYEDIFTEFSSEDYDAEIRTIK
jgi:hypothetical protein